MPVSTDSGTNTARQQQGTAEIARMSQAQTSMGTPTQHDQWHPYLDHGGPGVLLGGLNGVPHGRQVGVAILDMLHMPAEGLKALVHILCEGDLCVAINGDPAVHQEGSAKASEGIRKYRASQGVTPP